MSDTEEKDDAAQENEKTPDDAQSQAAEDQEDEDLDELIKMRSNLAQTDLAYEDDADAVQLEPYSEDAGDPLVAVPYDAYKREEEELLQQEVTSSPAFQCLDELQRTGKIVGTAAALFKAKYRELHEALIKSRNHENKLLQKAKKLTTKLEGQRAELERADQFPENLNTDVGRNREQLLRAQNKLQELQDREYQQEFKIEALTEERNILQREVQRIPKQSEIEKRLKEIQQGCEEIRKEISQRQNEMKNLKEDLHSKEQLFTQTHVKYDEAIRKLDKLKSTYLEVSSEPMKIVKESEKFERRKADLDRERMQSEVEEKRLREEISKLESLKRNLDDEHAVVQGEMDKRRRRVDDKESELSTLTKQLEIAKDREAQLLTDRVAIDTSLKNVNSERRDLHKELSTSQRVKEEEIKKLKRGETSLRAARDAVESTKAVRERMQIQLELQRAAIAEADLARQRRELQNEVNTLQTDIAQRDTTTALEQVKIQQYIESEKRQGVQQQELRIEVIELIRLAAIKSEEREQKSRDFLRAEHRHRRAVEELRTKDIQIGDHDKKHKELQRRLADFAQLYDVIKAERNKCVNLIQTCAQKIAEMREKHKILQNELEILGTTVTQKERQLTKARARFAAVITERDSLRNEIGKTRFSLNETRAKREQQQAENDRLNLLATWYEELAVKSKKQYEVAMQNKNERSVQVVEREEEVCVLHERENILEARIQHATLELQQREEEIRFLRTVVEEERRGLLVLRKKIPLRRTLNDELTTLQIQLAQCQDRAVELERSAVDPMLNDRLNILEVRKPENPAELEDRIDKLEQRVAEKEREILERQLVLEQDSRLLERLQEQTDANKDDTLTLAKSVNQLQTDIKQVTRKLMACLSELSMQQATAIKLSQVRNEKESILQDAYRRIEQGLPPTDEVEKEWNRMVTVDSRRKKDKEFSKQAKEFEELHTLASGGMTAADPRPNAYIPDDDTNLPIPRPYGAHAPFKPQEAGSNMRHIRKPQPKPIEI